MKKTAVALALTIALASGAVWAAPSNIEAVTAKADQGDVPSMLEAGRYYLTHNDSARGTLYLEHVIRAGGANAAYAHTALGQHYEAMSGSTLAAEAMILHYRQAAVAGDVVAQSRLGRYYLTRATKPGTPAEQRQQFAAQAQLLLAHAATAGNDTEAAYALGKALLNGDAFPKDVSRAETLLTRAANKNHLGSMHLLGMSEMARGEADGRRRLEQAANAGYGESMLALAKAYEAGQGVSSDLDQAGRWADKAIAANVAGARDLRSRISDLQSARLAAARPAPVEAVPASYGAMRPLNDDQRMAIAPVTMTGDPNIDRIARENAELRQKLNEITSLLSRMGNQPQAAQVAAAPVQSYVAPVQAQLPPQPQVEERDPNQLGLDAHSRGDYREAYRQFAKAAKRGNADAMNNQGMLLLQGQGVAVDTVEAMALFRAAAEKGHVTAARNIAYMYENGVGVAQDMARSRVWYQHSAALSSRVQRASTVAGL